MAEEPHFTHLTAGGEVSMVDVSAKPVLLREAVATGRILLAPETLRRIAEDRVAKGNVLAVARVAGIQAAKQTPSLIPLCHGLNLSHAEVEFSIEPDAIALSCRTRTAAQTGVEMEALAGVAVAALTIYDMCKAVDRSMQITDIRLLSKSKRPPEETP